MTFPLTAPFKTRMFGAGHNSTTARRSCRARPPCAPSSRHQTKSTPGRWHEVDAERDFLLFFFPPVCLLCALQDQRCYRTRTHLESRALVRGSLAGSLPFQAQLNEKLQQVDQQLVHHLLRLKVGSDVAQGVYHSQGAVPALTRGGRAGGDKRCDSR